MPLSRWFRGAAPPLRDRVVKALKQARDGDADGAIAPIAERFSDALAELRGLPGSADAGWLRLAARLAYRAGDMPVAADFAQQALAGDEGAATWDLVGRVRGWLKNDDAVAAFRRAAARRPPGYGVP